MPVYSNYISHHAHRNPQRVHGLTGVTVRVDFIAVVGRNRPRYGITETCAQANEVVNLHGIAIDVGYDLFNGRARTPRMLVRVQNDVVDLWIVVQ